MPKKGKQREKTNTKEAAYQEETTQYSMQKGEHP